jgi:hypothetical protein
MKDKITMIAEMTLCPFCGHSFDARQHVACQACPLQKSCLLVCCPACGFELVDVQKSTLATWAARLLFPKRISHQQFLDIPEDPTHDMAR